MLMLLPLAYANPGNSDMYKFTSGTSLLSETSNSLNTLKMIWLIVGKLAKVKSTPISIHMRYFVCVCIVLCFLLELALDMYI